MKVDVIRTESIVAHDTVVEVVGELTLEEWKEFGLKLMAAEKFCQWYLGWWWNNGHKKWSRETEAFIDECGYKRDTLRVYGGIYNSVKPVMRITDLSFNHHQIVAPLPPADQKKYLKRAVDEPLTVAALRKVIAEDKAEPPPPLPKGTFNVIYADPPWKYGDACEGGGVQSVGAHKHYPLMTIAELCELDIDDLSGEDAVLFLWVTSPLLAECFEVIEAWGFKYKASFVWDKIKHNMGHYNSVRHELLLICTKGSFMPENKKLYDSVVSIERTKHSEKPEKFREIIETLYPSGKKIELFARKQTKGWKPYGNDATLQG